MAAASCASLGQRAGVFTDLLTFDVFEFCASVAPKRESDADSNAVANFMFNWE